MIRLNDNEIELSQKAIINGKIAEFEEDIIDGSEITIKKITNINDLATEFEISTEEFEFFVNDRKVGADYLIKNKDSIQCKPKRSKEANNADYIRSETVNQNEITVNKNKREEGIVVFVNSKSINLSGKSKYLFVDIFNHIDIDMTKSDGNVILTINSKKAGYADEIKNGDVIEVYFENQKN